MKNIPFRAVRGFTLVEIIVVVAIIALLISILTPSLAQARREARATVCQSNLRQGLHGILLRQAETQMRREQWTTNLGWAVHSLRVNKGQHRIMTCPSDPFPRPVPAVQVQMFDGPIGESLYRGTTTGDAIFNRTFRDGSEWITDIQDLVEGTEFGHDVYDDDPGGDLLIKFRVSSQHDSTVNATAVKGSVYFHYNVLTYDGRLMWPDAGWAGGEGPIKLMWMSYAANASAGLQNVKGMPILLAEAGKFGIFPETLGRYQADNLARALRFHHGASASAPGLAGFDYTRLTWDKVPNNDGVMTPEEQDPYYQPRTAMNAGFVDGHVERLAWHSVFTMSTNPDSAPPIPKPCLWFGMRRSSSPSF